MDSCRFRLLQATDSGKIFFHSRVLGPSVHGLLKTSKVLAAAVLVGLSRYLLLQERWLLDLHQLLMVGVGHCKCEWFHKIQATGRLVGRKVL